MRNSVAITSCGLVAPRAENPSQLFEDLISGGYPAPVQLFDPRGLADPDVHEVRDFDPKSALGDHNFRPLNRPALFTVLAAERALAAGGWSKDQILETELGLVLGSMFGSVHTIAGFDYDAQKDGPKYAKPLDFANTVINAAAGQTAIWHALQGMNSTIATGSTSGLQALGYASELIASGRSSALLAGGVEELCFETYLGFAKLGLLACSRGPASAVPFAPDANGFRLAEGAGLLVLEPESLARARGAEVLGRLSGFASAYDPSRGLDLASAVTAMTRSMRAAIGQAGLTPDQIDACLASANGSATGDAIEAAAILTCFGEGHPPLTALKGALGEGLGATGALQVIAGLECLRRAQIPGLHGRPPARPGLENLCRETRSLPLRHILVLALGLDGGSCALVLSLPE